MTQSTSTQNVASTSAVTSTSNEKENVMSTSTSAVEIAVNAHNLSVARLAVAKLTDAQKRALARMSADFKTEYNASNISDWVAYKLACCNEDQQRALFALYLSQSRRIVTADIDAVKRNAYATNVDRVATFDQLATVENVAALRNNYARIVVRERRTTETVTDVMSAQQNARAFDDVSAVALDLLRQRTEHERTISRISRELDAVLLSRSADADLIARMSADLSSARAERDAAIAAAERIASLTNALSSAADSAHKSTSARRK
jgi:hypothetical protein